MRKEVVKSLRKEFSQRIKSRFGMFSLDEKSRGTPGSDLYVWEFSEDLHFFVYLLPNPKSYRDTFMIELGWSSGTAFPVHAAMQNKQRLDLLSDGRIRLPALWREQWRSALEPWWETGESVTAETGDEYYTDEETSRRVAKIPELVGDAVAKIEKYGIPFFEQIAAQRG